MKYLLKSWKTQPGKHEIVVENKNPDEMTRVRGYGFGVNFSSRCFRWSHNFTSTVDFLKFSDPGASL
jgi:hypothetical protein